MNIKFILTLLILMHILPVFSENITPITVIKITDGDTITAKIGNNSFSARLIGIDCYETSDINRAYKQAYNDNLSIDEVIKNGKYSTKHLNKLYQNSKNVYIDFMGIDKYKRALVVLYFDKLNINEEMIKNGGCKNIEY